MFNPPYKVYEGVIDPRLCDILVEEASKLKLLPGQVGPQEGRKQLDYRDSLVGFFSQEHWVTGILYHYAAIANAANWQLATTAPTPVQYTEYNEGHHYDWHMDMGGEPPNVPTTRKVSVVLLLSDGNDFEGGDFEIKVGWDNRDERVLQVDGMRKKGSVLVFPSPTPHRVTPVTAGVRKSLVCWVIGPRFR